MNKKNLILSTLLLIASAIAIVEILLNSKGEVLSDSTQTLWGFAFYFLTIIWATVDADNHEFEKPFDFGFLMYIFWPIAFPYYLCKTRGFDGLVFYIGFIGIGSGPWLLGLVAYTYAP